MTERCLLCGNRYAECTHHLIGGTARRKLADEDKLYIKICNNCHNMAVKPEDRIHGNPRAEILSKMLGQAIFERDYLVDIMEMAGDKDVDKCARSAFIMRYGRSYL